MIEQIPALNLTGTDPRILGWHRETTFLKSYPPKGDPNIFVIGAYSGTIAGLLIEQLPDARHWLFEPQDWACKQMRERFGHLANVHICEHGLGDRTGRFRMGLYTSYDCTFLRSQAVPFKDIAGTWFDGSLVEFSEFCRSQGLESVYYTSINVEGFEYVLIPHLARTRWLERMWCVGVSWHDTRFNCPVPGPYLWQGEPVAGLDETKTILAQTHDLVLSIDNWQSWVRREP